jgi:hypothetical protein
MIEWKIFIIKIMMIFFLYIISMDIIIPLLSYVFGIIMGDMILCADIPDKDKPLDVDQALGYPKPPTEVIGNILVKHQRGELRMLLKLPQMLYL